MSKIAHCESVWMKEQVDMSTTGIIPCGHAIYIWLCVWMCHIFAAFWEGHGLQFITDLWSALEPSEVLKKTAFVQTTLDPSRSNPAELHLTLRSGLVLHTAVTMTSFFGVLFIIFFILYIIFARISCHWRTVHDKLTYYLDVPVLPNV